MRRMSDIMLVGVDGGATKVQLHRVEILNEPLRFAATEPMVEIPYATSADFVEGFTPVPLAEQLVQHRAGAVLQRSEEAVQEAAILDSFCRAIGELGLAESGKPVVMGIGLPGLKTPDRRGISAMANGPRMPRFLDHLEGLLKDQGLTTLRPVHALGSDADYCGLGEHWGDTGMMRDVGNAYYLGIGTGVADALLLQGEIVPFDATKAWMAKTWEMVYSDDLSFERMVSARGIQQRYAGRAGLDVEALDRRGIYPWQIVERALSRENEAVEVVSETCKALAKLIFLRIVTLAVGAPETLLSDPTRRLSAEHPYVGSVFDRIVLGQRLGDMWGFSDFNRILREPVLARLAKLLDSSSLDGEVLESYLSSDREVREGLVVHSSLRNAPALGAAVDAYLDWSA